MYPMKIIGLRASMSIRAYLVPNYDYMQGKAEGHRLNDLLKVIEVK